VVVSARGHPVIQIGQAKHHAPGANSAVWRTLTLRDQAIQGSRRATDKARGVMPRKRSFK
jgi:hypothetical protein